MEEEIWLPVIGYEGLYEVSSEGNVRSLNYHREGRIQLLKPAMHRDGYLHVVLCKDGKRKQCFLHRLVAQAFITNPEGLSEVNHIDEDKTNNVVTNLEWCDRLYNMRYGTCIARMTAALSKPVQQLSKDGVLVDTWSSMMEAWRQTGVSYGHISECCNGKHRTAGGYVWRYAE